MGIPIRRPRSLFFRGTARVANIRAKRKSMLFQPVQSSETRNWNSFPGLLILMRTFSLLNG